MKPLALALFVLLVVAEAGADSFAPPRLSPDEAHDLVMTYLRKKNIELENYAMTRLSFDYVRKQWVAFFDWKECPCPIGSHFMVLIHGEDPETMEIVGGA